MKRSRRRRKTRPWRDFIELKRFSGRFASQIRFPATVARFKSKPDIVCWNEVARVGMQVTRKIFREILSRRLIAASLGRSRSNGCDVILEGNHIFLYDIKLFTGLFSSRWWNLRSQDVKKKEMKRKENDRTVHTEKTSWNEWLNRF